MRNTKDDYMKSVHYNEECVETEYDTYIEYIFFMKLNTCIKEKDFRERIKIAWLCDKKLFSDLVGTISFEFIHYSLHNVSHSVNILQNIYQLLGREAIDKLSVSDLWLLLECAYSHDIGMSVSREDLEEFWKDDALIEHIIAKLLRTSDVNALEVYSRIKKHIDMIPENIDENRYIIENNEDFKNNHPYWPLEIRSAITLITSECIRIKHANRSKQMIHKLLKEDYNHLKIENRLYQLVSEINYLHTEDFDKIFEKLPQKDTGFATDKNHPQLIALLLRIGDSLDVRNNRFDYWWIRYLGTLPQDSMKHFEKHKALTNFLIDEENVVIHIESDQLDVCRISREWLDMVDNNLKNLFKYWNKFAPHFIPKVNLKNIDLQVFFNKKPFKSSDLNNNLKVDTSKLLELLTGKNFYNTKLIVFRELLQNAIDATKVQIANKYYNDTKLLYKNKIESFSDLKPNMLPKHVFEDYEIQVFISIVDHSKLKFEIVDHGVGMDENGIKSLFKIGKGWEGREELNNIANNIPNWLTPTGGFGIGILGTFLVSEEITYITKSKYGPEYTVNIHTPASNLPVEKLENENSYRDVGTTVSFEIPTKIFLEECCNYFKYDEDDDTKLSDELDFVNHNAFISSISILTNTWIENIFTNIPFPITVIYQPLEINRSQEYENQLINDLLYDVSSEIIDSNNDQLMNSFWINNIYTKNLSYKSSKDKLNILVKRRGITLVSNNQKKGTQFSYKGIIVERKFLESDLNDSEKQILNICDKYFESIDIYNDDVRKVLQISRTNFTEELDFIQIIKDALYKLLKNFINNYNKLDFEIFDLICLFYNSDVIKNTVDVIEKTEKSKSNKKRLGKEKLFGCNAIYYNKLEYIIYKNIENLNNCIEELNNLKNHVFGPKTDIQKEFYKSRDPKNFKDNCKKFIEFFDNTSNILFDEKNKKDLTQYEHLIDHILIVKEIFKDTYDEIDSENINDILKQLAEMIDAEKMKDYLDVEQTGIFKTVLSFLLSKLYKNDTININIYNEKIILNNMILDIIPENEKSFYIEQESDYNTIKHFISQIKEFNIEDLKIDEKKLTYGYTVTISTTKQDKKDLIKILCKRLKEDTKDSEGTPNFTKQDYIIIKENIQIDEYYKDLIIPFYPSKLATANIFVNPFIVESRNVFLVEIMPSDNIRYRLKGILANSVEFRDIVKFVSIANDISEKVIFEKYLKLIESVLLMIKNESNETD